MEQAADPRLRGRPVAVGGDKRGIIAAASYEARKFGVHTPMPTVRARKLCPKLIVLPGDYEKYERFSRWMFSYAYDFTPEVEITSIDEGYFDLSGTRRCPVAIARTIRQAIHQSLKISVSEGLGSNKLISQIASKLHKPAAFAAVAAGQEIPFLHPLANHWLPGVGPQTASRLNAAGLTRIGQIAVTPPEMLQLLLGRWAVTLRQFANGVDDRPLIPAQAPAQSYSHQETFAQDQTDEPRLEATLRRMTDRLMSQIRADGKSIRTLTLKVRYNDMDENQCGESLAAPTDLESDIYGRLRPLLRQAWKRRVSLRMVSLKFSNVYTGCTHNPELPLAQSVGQREARRRLAAVVDELRHVRGRDVILRGHDFVLRTAQEAAAGGGDSSERRAVQGRRHIARGATRVRVRCVPLNVHSYYSFLNSTLSIEAMIALARKHGYSTLALTDQGNLHGAVAFAQQARAAGIRPIFGAEIRVGEHPLQLYAQTAAGYHNLCRWLSALSRDPSRPSQRPEHAASPGDPSFDASLFTRYAGGLLAVGDDPRLAPYFPDRFYLGVSSSQTPPSRDACPHLPRIAIPPVHYATPADRWKFDIVQSIRTLTLLRQEHPEKQWHGAFHFRSPAEMSALFEDHPQWLSRTQELAERCAFELPFHPPQFPAFVPPDSTTPPLFLRRLVLEGFARRYPSSASMPRSQIEEELRMIGEVGYEEYFLVVWDILQACRRRGIDWITRGSAADSLVCYCLGISDVCPIRFGLYFHRFLNKERMSMNKLPDIDIDFPHDRKDDVIDLIFERYGSEHAAVVGGFSTFQARSAFAEIAKVLGVAERDVRRFTEHFPWTYDMVDGTVEEAALLNTQRPTSNAQRSTSNAQQPVPVESAPVDIARGKLAATLFARPECGDLPVEEEPYKSALEMAAFLDGFPRYPKMHPCGVVLSRQPMHELMPTFISHKGYATTHGDMDAVEAIGLVKIDILAQGGLSVMRDVQHMLRQRNVHIDLPKAPSSFVLVPRPRKSGGKGKIEDEGRGTRTRTKDESSPEPWTDPAVWDMIAGGGARAVHHIESPAMVGLCRMAQVRDIDGLIAIVSVIRPGAANEQKKLQFTRRYQGLEPVSYPHPCLEPILQDAFGLVVYEEHILQICCAFAGLPLGRADVLRRALIKQQWKTIDTIGIEFLEAARRRGHNDPKIGEVWNLVSGFAGYAFCKAHSAAYGVEAYQSAWLKRYFPVEFMAAVLTHGKGFYHPLVYVLECHRLGIPLLSPWINAPGPAFTPHAGATAGRQDGSGYVFSVTQASSLQVPTLPASGEASDIAPKRRCCAAKAEGLASCTQDACVTAALNTYGSAAAIRVPVTRIKGLTDQTKERLLAEHQRGPFPSLRDFYRRVAPWPEEMEALLRAGALDGFNRSRTALFWEIQFLLRAYGHGAGMHPTQGWLIPPPDFSAVPMAGRVNTSGAPEKTAAFGHDAHVALTEPTRQQRLQWEQELLDFPASGHPLELYPDVAWDTYCPVARLGEYIGQRVVTCGLVIEQRIHHQVTGEPMKFLTLADWTGMVETELFASTYRSYGLATVRYPVLEITATVEPFENGRGFTLRVHHAGKPRTRSGSSTESRL